MYKSIEKLTGAISFVQTCSDAIPVQLVKISPSLKQLILFKLQTVTAGKATYNNQLNFVLLVKC